MHGWRDEPPSVSRGVVLGNLIAAPPTAVAFLAMGYNGFGVFLLICWGFVAYMWFVRATLR